MKLAHKTLLRSCSITEGRFYDILDCVHRDIENAAGMGKTITTYALPPLSETRRAWALASVMRAFLEDEGYLVSWDIEENEDDDFDVQLHIGWAVVK